MEVRAQPRVSPRSTSNKTGRSLPTDTEAPPPAGGACGNRGFMRILFLSAVLPMTWGAEVRAFRFLEYLAKGHEVDLISFHAWPGARPPRAAQAALVADLRARCRDVTLLPLPGLGAWSNCLCNSISEEPFL